MTFARPEVAPHLLDAGRLHPRPPSGRSCDATGAVTGGCLVDMESSGEPATADQDCDPFGITLVRVAELSWKLLGR